MRAKFFSERLFVFAAAERNCLKSHLSRVLHTEAAESADALNGDDITAPRAGISQGVKNCHARAHERTSFFSRQFVWNQCQRFRRRDHVFGVTAVEIDASNFALNTHCEITAPAL